MELRSSLIFRTELEARGVDLEPPASDISLTQLEAALGVALDPSIRAIYRQFDGFRTPDRRSQLTLWPLQRVMDERGSAHLVGPEFHFAFGDFLIDSDLLVTCLSTPTPVRMLSEQKELADSVPELLDKILQGAFDFC